VSPQREGLGHDTDGERSNILGDLGDYGAAGACAAAHTGGDKDHVRAAHRFVEFLAALFRRLLPH
jgi:hypothetical protein